ncbi:unnamed protein product [Rotaria magnacalcarata]|nr:unnamed protein product [Rotaria magnacalcarata]
MTITISEASYYIKNTESPIAKQQEVIFHTFLFTIICLEISGLIFLIVKLMFIPIVKKVIAHYYHAPRGKVTPTHENASHESNSETRSEDD